jgi:hypothetical protein
MQTEPRFAWLSMRKPYLDRFAYRHAVRRNIAVKRRYRNTRVFCGSQRLLRTLSLRQ